MHSARMVTPEERQQAIYDAREYGSQIKKGKTTTVSQFNKACQAGEVLTADIVQKQREIAANQQKIVESQQRQAQAQVQANSARDKIHQGLQQLLTYVIQNEASLGTLLPNPQDHRRTVLQQQANQIKQMANDFIARNQRNERVDVNVIQASVVQFANQLSLLQQRKS